MSVVRGRASGTYFKGYIEGGPQLAEKLRALAKGLRDELVVQAVDDAAAVIEVEWRGQALATFGRGPGTGHYVDAIGHRSRPGKNGATAYIGLTEDVPLEPNEAHPREYATKLEFNGQATLRPAFDSTRQKALDAMGAKVVDLIEKAV